MSIRNLQYFKDDFWNRQREEFLSKEDGINGILLGQDWNLVGNTTANNPISLPSLDTFDEIYVEMFHSEGTIMHQEEFKKESLLFESTNTTHREILLDSIGDTNTYMTYDIENNTITATSIEGNVIDENSTNVFLGVYVKKTGTAEGELGANRVSYDDTVSELGASDVQGAIEKLDEKIDEKFDNIPSGSTGKSAYDYAKDNGYTGTEEEFAALMNTNFSTTYLTQKNPSGSGTFTFDGDAQFTGDITATDEDGNEISLVDIFESTNNLPSAGTKLIETLPANETTVTFTSDEITENTTLNAVYTSIFGVKLESANVENGVLTLTFEAQEEDMTVVALINATMSDSDETHLGDIDADEVKVDDSNLGLGVSNVQGALEKLKENVDNIANNGSGSGVSPLNVVNPSISTGNTTLTVSWEDPEDTTIDGTVMAEWQGTKLVYKLGAYPTSVTDGVLAVDNQVKDQYKDNGFTITGLTNGETYYIALFPYSTDGVVNDNEENRLSGTPVPYRTMTIKIDQTDSNPETCCTYADNAIGMTVGSDEWDEFFGHYPCLFKDGVEVGKLNPDNFAQFEDGTTADITSGDAGDVMIAFPRLGVKISTDSNDVVTISMTDNPNDENFTYYAHTRGTTNKDVFYLGAYKGYNSSNKLRSISGKTPTANTTIGNFRTYAQANGTGYDQSGFYQLVFRQCMYLLKYKNLDSQTAVGRGYVDGNSAAIATGNTNAKGMDWGETTGTQQMKLFGLEDFWGNVYEFIDGIYSDASRNICTATDGFNDTGSGYTNQGSSGFASDTYGYMTKVQGTSEMGFVLKANNGSETTYYCDSANVYASRLAYFGGIWNYASVAGAFLLNVSRSASFSDAYFSARLMFL